MLEMDPPNTREMPMLTAIAAIEAVIEAAPASSIEARSEGLMYSKKLRSPVS